MVSINASDFFQDIVNKLRRSSVVSDSPSPMLLIAESSKAPKIWSCSLKCRWAGSYLDYRMTQVPRSNCGENVSWTGLAPGLSGGWQLTGGGVYRGAWTWKMLLLLLPRE